LCQIKWLLIIRSYHQQQVLPTLAQLPEQNPLQNQLSSKNNLRGLCLEA
jgi:hypothetical protein